MRRHPHVTEERIKKFLRKLKLAYYPKKVPLESVFYRTQEPISLEEVKHKTHVEINPGDKWGKNFECAWFHFTGEVPKDFEGKEVVALLDVGGEACVFDEAGNPVQGLTNKKIEWTLTETIIKKRVYLFESAVPGTPVSIWVDAAANNILGLENVLTYESLEDGIFHHADLAILDREGWYLYIDYSLLTQLMQELPETSRHRKLIRYALNDVINIYGDGTGEDIIKQSRERLKDELGKPANASSMEISAIGHAHIDIAWLWPLRETIRKTARTFSTALMVMDEYPDYKFGASQPQLYQFMKEHYPGLYKRLFEAVKRKQWECQGAMWVEADCNLISGESMIRQILHGQRYYEEEFGIRVNNLWLPDVFGYSAALPQIMKKAGIDYFMSQKISWNQFNKFPNQTFYWEGIDGTRVFTHFLAPNNYRSDCSVMDLMNLERDNADSERLENALFLYGAGDGGGGPTRIYVEKLKRTQNLEDVPRTKMEFASDFFVKAEKNARDLQTWSGELYLELHRGTLTTHARTKKFNRQIEFFLREIECWYALYQYQDYPFDNLNACWKTLMLNQFHDILPGTSITRVHLESESQYRGILNTLHFLQDKLMDQITEKDKASLSVFNSLNWKRKAYIQLPEGWQGVTDDNGENLPVQINDQGAYAQVTLGSLGVHVFRKGSKTVLSEAGIQVNPFKLENDLIMVELSKETGQITSIFDKEVQRELLAEEGNQLLIYHDEPNLWDAWDVDAFYMEQEPERPEFQGVKQIESGSLLVKVQLDWTYRDSTIIQYMSLRRNQKQVFFENKIDWKEQKKMLRADFPLKVQSSQAAFEIQYGHVKRTTHYNTSWDLAQFEVVGHKWADFSQPDYGVSLLNDCKYGYRIKENVISLHLLRSPIIPDKMADQVEHTFTYALFPHRGPLSFETIKRAYELNVIPQLTEGVIQKGDNEINISGENVIVEAVKRAERGEGVIIRMYECMGTNVQARLGLKEDEKIFLTNLMEEHDQPLHVEDNYAILDFKPFEIITVRVTKKKASLS